MMQFFEVPTKTIYTIRKSILEKIIYLLVRKKSINFTCILHAFRYASIAKRKLSSTWNFPQENTAELL